MKFVGKVQSKNEEAQGHSTLRISGAFDVSDAQSSQAPIEAVLIVSTPRVELLDRFRVGNDVVLEGGVVKLAAPGS